MAATLVSEARNVAVSDDASVSLLTMARRVAATDVTVFINGPTGTGKEVLARFVHNNSSRGEQPFVAVNCAAIPENMLEAILFGHEKGGFTGASSANKGIFRAMVRVPKDLSGASLLGVHNWVKGNIARNNPGASPDYTISDSRGNRLTLSDVATKKK